jgi:hypothetical protein
VSPSERESFEHEPRRYVKKLPDISNNGANGNIFYLKNEPLYISNI